jgi:protein-S-isoprenylcysteine O-methyltransferase Ste14
VPALLGLAGALVLFEWARRTIRGRYFSWIFSCDAPTFLCTRGPYAYIRNPFYTSYLMTMTSTALMMPNLFRGVVVLGMVAYFSAAAVHEERKFESSVVAKEYEAYKRRTGRFVPKLDALIAGPRSPRA